MRSSLVGSEMCIRDRFLSDHGWFRVGGSRKNRRCYTILSTYRLCQTVCYLDSTSHDSFHDQTGLLSGGSLRKMRPGLQKKHSLELTYNQKIREGAHHDRLLRAIRNRSRISAKLKQRDVRRSSASGILLRKLISANVLFVLFCWSSVLLDKR